MWHDHWQTHEVLLAEAIAIAETAVRTSMTLATMVIGTAALVALWWYLVRRDRRGD